MPLWDFRTAWGLCQSLVMTKHQRILEYYLGDSFRLGMADLRQREANGEWAGDLPKRIDALLAFHKTLRFDRLKAAYPHAINLALTLYLPLKPEKYGFCPELLKELEEVFDDNLRECTKEHPCHTSVEDFILNTLRRDVAMCTATLNGSFALALFVEYPRNNGCELHTKDSRDNRDNRHLQPQA